VVDVKEIETLDAKEEEDIYKSCSDESDKHE